MYLTKNSIIPSPSSIISLLDVYASRMPQYIDYDVAHYWASHLTTTAEKQTKMLSDLLSMNIGTISGTNETKDWILSHGYGNYFKKTKTGISLDKNDVEEILLRDIPDDLRAVLMLSRDLSQTTGARGTLLSLMQNPMSDKLSYEKHRMLECKPIWDIQNTGRIGMKKPAIQNIDRILQPVMTVPEGYVYVHADSGQCEPRITMSWILKDPVLNKLVMMYNDAYYAYVHYVMYADTLVGNPDEWKPFEITDELKHQRKDIKTFVNAVMYGATSNPTNNPVKGGLIKRIGEHPMRKAHVHELENLIRTNKPICTYFGTEIDIYASDKLKDIDAGYYDTELLKLAINNPIQGTAADLMRYSASAVSQLLMSKAKKSHILNYIHDAVTLAVHEDDFPKIENDLNDLVAYEVEGWLPITQDLEIGRQEGIMPYVY